MGLQADGRRGFQVRLGHEHPVSYPFELRYKETIDLYQACLKEAAEYRLVLDFHGANKPAGESRTWPNELTREGIRGYEFRGPWAAHNATLPFTRILAGHADYTPMHFGDRRCETSEAHQIASAIIFTSPLLIFADHPREILEHEAVELIKRIPC
jgi:alpha-glucosidase